MLTSISPVLVWAISLASILCMLLRPRGIAEALWVGGGALLLVVARLVPLGRAVHAVYEGLDVYLFLAGMMILAELAREEGVFEWVADAAARHAGHSSGRLFLLVYLVGVAVTALLSNDATAVVLTPAVLAATRRTEVDPKPYLLACAFVANAASFVFPISNPANLVLFGRNIPSLGPWLRIFLLPSLVSAVLTFLCLRWISHRRLREKIVGRARNVSLSTEGKLAFAGLLIAGAALIASSALGLSLGTSTFIAALLAVVLVVWRDRTVPLRVGKGVSWSVLPLVAGLFVIVEALQGAGLFRAGLVGMHWLAQASAWEAKFVASFAVALLSNGMNNLPVALMSGTALMHDRNTAAAAHAILIGVDLGPNLSVTGSLATILWLIALRREQVDFRAGEFLKVGLIAMPVALIGSLFVLAS